MPVVEEQYSQSSSDGESGNEGFYFRKSKPFQKNPSKIFVGGLPYSTSDDELKRVFSRFGLISEVVVMKDNITKRSRGFGFVTFSDAVSVDMVLDEHERDPIVLNRKKIDPKRAIPKKVTARRTKKVFVGGISSDTSQEDIYDYFKHFGQIIEAMLIVDKTTNKHKGFGFVTYDNYDSVDEICCQQFHNINGKKVETKRAQPKEGTLQKSKKQGEFYVDYSDASKYAYMNYYPPDQFYAMYSPYYGRYVLLPYYPTSTGSAGEQQVFAGESYLAQYPNSPDAAAAAYGFWSTNSAY